MMQKWGEPDKKIGLEHLASALREVWSGFTSSDWKNWTKENPAYGQCAVTALIVQDYFGGSLLRVVATGKDGDVSHYYNELTDGKIVDLTKEQFQTGTTYSKPEYRTRKYVLSFKETADRYGLLKAHLAMQLGIMELVELIRRIKVRGD